MRNVKKHKVVDLACLVYVSNKILIFKLFPHFFRAIYFGAYDTAKEMFENPGI